MKNKLNKINWKNIKETLRDAALLSRRELWVIFSSLQTYIVFSLFLIILTVLSFVFGRLSDYGTSDLSQFYTYVVGSFTVIIPALTMGFISREKEKGTIEYLLTQPLKETSYVLSKLLSGIFLVFVLILTTIPFVLFTLLFSGDADLGQIVMQSISPFLVGVSFVSIGITFSAIFSSEITAFIASLLSSVILFIMGSSLLNFLPDFVRSFLEKFSVLTHYQSLSRGVLDFRDVIFFVSFTCVFFLATLYYIFRIKYPSGDKKLKKIGLYISGLVIFFIAFMYFGQGINLRLDLTSSQKYTISAETTKILNTIDQDLEVIFFESSNLPAELSAQNKSIRDLLTDLTFASGQKVKYSSQDPIGNTDLQAQIQSYGIEALQLRVNRDNSSEVVSSYYSIGLAYGDKKDKIDLNVSGINDLEFQLATKIKNIVGKDKATIGIVKNNVESALTKDLTILNAQLTELYTIEEIELTKDTDLSMFSSIYIPSANNVFDAEVNDKLVTYFNNGGGIFITTENVLIDENSLPKRNPTNITAFLAELGVTSNIDLVHDLKNNNMIALSSDFFPVIVNFPQWIMSGVVDSQNTTTKGINTVSMLWANSISSDQSKISELGLTVKDLFKTSDLSNIQKDESEWDISIEQQFAQSESDTSFVVAKSIENSNNGRIVVVGDGQFLSDGILEALAQRESQDANSISFGLNSIAWVSKDDILGGLKSKVKTAQQLKLLDYQKLLLVASVNVFPIFGLGITYVYLKRVRKGMRI